MSAALRVLVPGPLTTLQDGGRQGWLRFGLPPSGAMDKVALATANALVGNPADTGALEITMGPAAFRVEAGSTRIAFAGGEANLTIDGKPALLDRSHSLAAGAELRLSLLRRGLRLYLAVRGGFLAAPVFGSTATNLRAGIGGFAGRAIAAGDELPIRGGAIAEPELRLPFGLAPPSHPRLRVVPGPQTEYFTADALATLLSAEYAITPQADRMGYRLAGPRLAHAKGFNSISDAVAPGCIQVPGEGQPIIMMADRQTTGGYPKLATIISADLPALAQRRPGDKLRFEEIGLDAAREARRLLRDWLSQLPGRLLPVVPLIDSERLLTANLISGVTDGSSS